MGEIMGQNAFSVNLKFVQEECYKCKVPFAFTEYFYNQCQEKGSSFYCPNGHSQVYTESKIQKLEKRLKWAEESSDRYRNHMESAQKSASAYRGQATRLKNRIKNGVCPCCQRTFQNLKRHIDNKHPEYKEDTNGTRNT